VLPLPVALPDEVGEIARLAGGLTLADASRGPLGCLMVLVLHEQQFERWEFRGELPCTVDDLVRAISGYSQGRAVALVHDGVVSLESPDGTEDRRSVVTTVEHEGRRMVLLQTLTVAEGAFHPAEAFLQEGADPGVDGWIGVPPTEEVRIEFPVPENAPGGTVGEG